jgi:PST family polysaccharide transporter
MSGRRWQILVSQPAAPFESRVATGDVCRPRALRRRGVLCYNCTSSGAGIRDGPSGLARHTFRNGARSGGQVIDTEDKKRLLGNFASLSVLQGANYILPFITVPYLTRVLGPSRYGLIGFAAAFVNYFTILTGYGFNLSATKEISLRRDYPKRVSAIFSSVMIIKSALLALSLVLLLVIVSSFHKFRADAYVYLFSFGLVVGNVLFPVWLYQGMERMKYITYINLSGRLALTVAIFAFVSGENGYMRYVIMSSATAILVGIASLVCALKVFDITFVLPSFADLRREAIDGWYVFISSISIVLYTSSTTFLLGLFTNNTIVGYFAGADKIRQAIQGVFTPVFQTLYPYVNKLAHDSKEQALRFMRREVVWFGTIGGLICLAVFVNAGFLVRLILGPEYSASVALLRILAFAPVLIILGNILTVQCLLSLGLKREYSLVYIYSSVIGVLVMIYLTRTYGARGVSLSVVLVEALVMAMTLYRMRKNDVHLFGGGGAR